MSPKWILRPKPSYFVISHKNGLLDCQTEGIPASTHQWKKASSSGELQAIVSGPHIHVLENGSLAIIDARKGDEGDYVCEA